MRSRLAVVVVGVAIVVACSRDQAVSSDAGARSGKGGSTGGATTGGAGTSGMAGMTASGGASVTGGAGGGPGAGQTGGGTGGSVSGNGATAGASGGASGSGPPGIGGNWALVFEDEFTSGNAPSTTSYHFYPVWGDNNNPEEDTDFLQLSAGGDDVQTGRGGYDASNASVNDGKLILAATNQSARYAGRDWPHRTSMVRTQQAFLYGYFEVRLKLPAGQGHWSAFWLMPDPYVYTSNQEIDILEAPSTGSSRVYMNVHRHLDGGPINGGTHFEDLSSFDDDFSDDFHTFACLWEASAITWYVDGIQRKQYTGQYIPNQPFQVLIDFQVGGSWPGPTNGSTPWPAQIEAEYVRVYQRI